MTISLKKHPSLLYTEDVVRICQPLLHLNITTFANARVDQHGNFSSLCTHPEFMLNYVAKEYHRADIHARSHFTDIGNCLMWDVMDCFGKTEEMLQDAARFNFKHIFTVVEPQATHTDFYHFGTHLPHQSFNQLYVNHFDLLKMFIRHFRETVDQCSIMSQAYTIQIPQDLPCACEIELADASFNLVQNRLDFIQSLHQQKKQGGLSPRQIECAHYLLQGMNAKEIALQLGLSHRTVEGYIETLKRRMSVRNKAELITALLSND